MEELNIPCPECRKGKLEQKTVEDKKANCNHCGETFIMTGVNRFRYAKPEDLIEGDPTLASKTQGGKGITVNAFIERKNLNDPEIAEKIKNLPYTELSDIADIDNGEKYEWVQVGNTKYGRCMYCLKTGIKRGQTMGEFYGSGIVD